MRQNSFKPDSAGDIACYFAEAQLYSQKETLGQIVKEIMRSGSDLSRKTICAKLACRLEQASNAEDEQRFRILIDLLSGSPEGL